MRPRRSLLYVPGANPRAMDKARSLDADGVILDLEDAVAPGAKDDARRQVAAVVAAGGFGHREVLLRVNAASTPWGAADLRLAGSLPLDGVVLPKVERAGHVTAALAALESAPDRSDRVLWPMIETPRGVLAAAGICAASNRITGVIMGTSDLLKELRAQATPGREALLPALGTVLLAARAHGLEAIDGVHLDLGDEAGFEATCLQARRLGFDGRSLIHPRQIPACNRLFTPTSEEVRSAREVIDAWERSAREGLGVVMVDGRLVEKLHVEEARRLLALAEAIRAREAG